MLIDNEKVYDEQISPLMAQIIDICKINKIPMFATFCYQEEMRCTTSIPPKILEIEDDNSQELITELYKITYTQPQFCAFTITTNPKDK